MFGKIAGFEFRYQTRQPIFWVAVILFFLLPFAAITSDQIRIGDTTNIHKNSPFNIAQICLVMNLFYMFVTTAFVANVIVRDDETGYGPIVRATPMSRFDYLFGRFTGAFAAAALAYLVVPLAVFIGSLMPWVDPDTLGPNHLTPYAFAYFSLALPGVFLTSSLFFAVTTATRSLMGAYLAALVFLVLWFATNIVVGFKPEWRHIMGYIEPLGVRAYSDTMRYWTASERNSLIPPFTGVLLANRLIWTGAGFAFLALAYGLYRSAPAGRPAAAAKTGTIEAGPSVPSNSPLAKPVFDGATAWAQLSARTRLEMAQVFRSPAYLVLVGLGLFNGCANLFFIDDYYGTPPHLVTRLAITAMQGGFSLFPLIIAIFYAGELVWRERDRRTHEIIDASAIPDWAFVIPKTLAIFLVLVSTYLFSVALAVLIQLAKGGVTPDLEAYLDWYVLPGAIDAFLIAVLAVFTQAIAPHKFWGWAVMLVYIVAGLVFDSLGWENHLLLYAGGPNVPLSDMNAQGHFWIGATWFRVYWAFCAIVLLVLSHALWRRGAETRFGPRLARLPRRLAGPAGVITVLALIGFVASGGYIYLNTHVWNDYRTKITEEKRLAAAEKTLLIYENAPQPSVADLKLVVNLYPHQHRLEASGTYRLENRTGQPISDLHLRDYVDADITSLSVPGATLAFNYEPFHYRIYHLAKPLALGQSLTIGFTSRFGHPGFRNNEVPSLLTAAGAVLDNGTFVNATGFTPTLGLDRDDFLKDRVKRRKYGLQPELRMAKLEDVSARNKNLFGSNTDWINSDITVTTDADQTPIAPGRKVSDTTSGGRRTAHFISDAPIQDFISIQSGRYLEKKVLYKGIDISVFYDARHTYNVDRMIAAAKASLDYYQANFSPYQFHQFRFIEFPDYSQFAQSFANTVPWSEGLGYIADVRDPNRIDYVTYVGAHEIGHQWWGHQVIGAKVQGVTLLDESLAQYSALMVMEKLYGPDKIRRFLKYELDNYLRSRGGERLEELPLGRNEDQAYIHYRKGSLVMYLMKDQIGEDAVNRALRRLIRQSAFKGAPYPTSLDLVNDLRAEAPADKQALITDLFEKITLYDVKSTAVAVTPRPDGRFNVRLTVDAKKVYADGKGRETSSAINGEMFDLGLFTAKPGEGAFGRENVLLFEKRPLKSGVQTFDFVVAKRPVWAGVDPYNKWIDKNSDDNLIKVEKAAG